MDWPTIQRNWTARVPRMTQRWPAPNGSVLDADRTLAKAEIAAFSEGALPVAPRMDPRDNTAALLDSARMVPLGEDPSDDDAHFGEDAAAANPVGRSA